MHIHMQVDVCTCIWQWRQRRISGVLLILFSSIYSLETSSLTETEELWARLVAVEPQSSSCLHTGLVLQVQMVTPSFLHGCWGPNSGAFACAASAVTHRAVSAALTTINFLDKCVFKWKQTWYLLFWVWITFYTDKLRRLNFSISKKFLRVTVYTALAIALKIIIPTLVFKCYI